MAEGKLWKLSVHHVASLFVGLFLVLWFGDSAMAFTLTSSSFSDSSKIPAEFTCEGTEVSPPLRWDSVPAGTKSFALVSDDPDAPAKTWVHWVIYNIPPDSRELPQGFPHDEVLPDGIRQGVNDAGEIGYGSPCPPPGKPHRYYFKLYALDSILAPVGTMTKEKLLGAIHGHVLGEAVLMGTYER